MAWTSEQRDTAIRLWREGKSAAYIADELETTITRNAVVGLMHRMGIRSPKHNPHSPVREYAPHHIYARSIGQSPRKREALERRPAVPEAPPIQPKPVSLLEAVVGECRWPLNDSWNFEEFRFCGAGVWPGSSYCAGHHRLVHRPQERRSPGRRWGASWSPAGMRGAEIAHVSAPIEAPVESPPLFAEHEDFEFNFVKAGRSPT